MYEVQLHPGHLALHVYLEYVSQTYQYEQPVEDTVELTAFLKGYQNLLAVCFTEGLDVMGCAVPVIVLIAVF